MYRRWVQDSIPLPETERENREKMEEMEGYLLDITVSHHGGEGTTATLENLEEGMRGMKDQLHHAFKVLGENRYMLVVSSENVEDVMKMVNTRGGHFSITSLPIIDYERFARGPLGVVDSMLPERKPAARINPSKGLFYLQATLEPGKSQEEFLEIWRQEAVVALKTKFAGQVPTMQYKVVMARKAVIFIQVDGATLDNISFNLPITRLMGDKTQLETRGLKVIVTS